jgi:metal-sulfur cluster biosynthetic enzyme
MTSSATSQEAEILSKLKVIIDPDLHQDIVSLGFVKDLKIDGTNVSFCLELTTPACPVREEFRTSAEAAVRSLPWVKNVAVTLSSTKKKRAPVQADDKSGAGATSDFSIDDDPASITELQCLASNACDSILPRTFQRAADHRRF